MHQNEPYLTIMNPFPVITDERNCRASMSEWVLPSHTNALGTIFGGVVVSWIDIVGVTAAQRYARAPVVTLCIDHLQFLAPIKVGDTVTLEAEVIHVGKTSIDIEVNVIAENTVTGETKEAAKAYLTYVALDPAGRPTAVPAFVPRTEAGRRRVSDAEERRAQRRRWR